MGAAEGAADGTTDGAVEGTTDGATEGALDGAADGALEGGSDGAPDGAADGAVEGATDGTLEGALEDAGELHPPTRTRLAMRSATPVRFAATACMDQNSRTTAHMVSLMVQIRADNLLNS